MEHNPDGYAPNMAWRVVNENGEELKRGPEWACWLFASTHQQNERRAAWPKPSR